MKFSDMKYERVQMSELLPALKTLAEKITCAKSANEAKELFWEYQKQSRTVATSAILAEIRHSIDTTDQFYEQEKDFYDENSPIITNAELTICKAFVESPFRDEMEKELGSLLFQKLELNLKSMTEEILPLMQKENALVTKYDKLYASAQIDFNGEKLTVSELAKYKKSADRETRKKAYYAEGQWFDSHREELDELYARLVENRTAQAKKMGYESYIPLGAIRMHRIGYGIAEMAAYRKQIEKDVVPVIQKIKQIQKERINVEAFKFWDDAFAFADGNPTPKGSPEEILAAGTKMYRDLSPETAEFIDVMMQNNLFDVLSKKGKAPGGYCTYIPNYKVPFIFSNFNATSDDVDVLTHEAGHAFAAFMAAKQALPSELEEPGMESCEIHSMSMEFLTAAYHNLFFKEDTTKYELAHAEDAMNFLPYGTMVDEFQHIMYANPNFTAQERCDEWLKLEKKYRPWIDFGDMPFYSRGAGWQKQLHIYELPFYYIDYCLAQTVALQFFTAFLQNPKEAWQRYLSLVKKAGSESYVGLINAAGFKNPFNEGTLKNVADTVYEFIQSKNAQL